MKKLSIKAKFRIGSAGILTLFCVIASVWLYYYLKQLVTENIYKETEIFIATAEATRNYVKDVLRPKMTGLLPPDSFIPQAMSTTFVGREIMGRLHERFPNFYYRRAAKNPINPVNQADAFELNMLKWFAGNPDTREWHGLIQKSNRSFYTRLRAIYAETECLYCHGKPEDAPEGLTALYGTESGYNFKVGDVVAADTVYIPVDVTFVRIKEATWMVFVLFIIFLFSVASLFHILFNRTVVSELKGLLTTFRSISEDETTLAEVELVTPGDEIEQLKGAFETVASDLRQAHDGVKASETKYRNLFETSLDALLIFDHETKLMDINFTGINMFGFEDRAEALSIETCYQLFWDTRDAESFFRTVEEKGFVQELEVPMVDRAGRQLEVRVSATVRKDENDRYAGIDGMFHDVTEKRRLEKYLARTEKLASIGQLASGVAHEINNPLGVISCYSNLIAKGQESNSQLEKDIQIILKHTDQCKSVVEALLNFARVSEPAKRKTDITVCIEEVLSVLETQMKMEHIQVRREFASGVLQLTVDEQQIKQVLMNLLLNARQAMTDGGDLTVRTIHRKEKKVVAVEVVDTGTGIAEKHIDRIFDPFFTTKETEKGTGLGLSVSYGIVKQHGGDIEVETSVGEGSTFRVLLPADEPEN